MSPSDLIKLAIRGDIASITINNPSNSNRFTFLMMTRLVEVLREVRQQDLRAVVLRSAGADFTAGRDQSEQVPGVGRVENLSQILRVNETLLSIPAVTISLIRGRCLGFGTGLSLHSDISIASDTAVLGFNEIVHGFPPLVVLAYLTRHVPPKIARELVLTGRSVSAHEARELGLVNRVVADTELEDAGDEILSDLAERDKSALRLIKEFSDSVDQAPPAERAEYGEHAVRRLVDWIENRPGHGSESGRETPAEAPIESKIDAL
ncbi:MAG: Enoyl-CoA hydratase/isomerase [Sphaerisporangium sp.]|nr:Enoyl-CoA hydratase/isomerase [Sphaerisporangium sp.]